MAKLNVNSQMSMEFPELCKWNVFTIDSPSPGWEDDKRNGKIFATRQEQGDTENE